MSSEVKWPFPRRPGRLWNVASTLTVAAVGGFSKLMMRVLNDVQVYNMDVLTEAVERRHPSQPLITVSNHACCMDDPLIWGILKWRYLCSRKQIRWTLAAEDICFTNKPFAIFFCLGQTIPVRRGGGVYQRGVDFMVEQLNKGRWVHMFPEGKVNMTKEMIRLKWGVGRLIEECQHTPIVIPIWHVGMDSVLPNVKPYIPQAGKRVTVLVGQPFQVQSILTQLRKDQKSPMEKRKVLTDHIQDQFVRLKAETEALHYQTVDS
ncbi:tafazzin-like [Branchiostoma floridae x Branchiostoma japonicum]